MSTFLDSLAQTQEMAKRDAWDALVRDKVDRVAYDQRYLSLNQSYEQHVWHARRHYQDGTCYQQYKAIAITIRGQIEEYDDDTQ